jgi:hypothetical protein
VIVGAFVVAMVGAIVQPMLSDQSASPPPPWRSSSRHL